MNSENLDARLRDLEVFTFQRPMEPDEDPTGRLAYRAMCEKLDKQENGFYRFPINSVVDKLDRAEVDLSHCGIGDQGAQALAETLKINSSIVSLNLTDNHLSVDGADHIFNALTQNHSIRSVNFSDNRLGHQAALSSSSGATLGMLMHTLLNKNTTVTELTLKNNKIGDRDMSIVKDAADVSRLTYLDLSSNEIGTNGAASVATFIASSSLVEIHLGWNRFQRSGSLAILRDGIDVNGTVRKFSMPWCGISDDGGEVLGQVIEKSSVLEEIDISHNRIGPKGAEAIARGIRGNSTLTRLIMSHNPIYNPGRDAIMGALKDNTSLVLCAMEFTGVGRVNHQLYTELRKSRPKLLPKFKPQANPQGKRVRANGEEIIADVDFDEGQDEKLKDHVKVDGHYFNVHDGWFPVL